MKKLLESLTPFLFLIGALSGHVQVLLVEQLIFSRFFFTLDLLKIEFLNLCCLVLLTFAL